MCAQQLGQDDIAQRDRQNLWRAAVRGGFDGEVRACLRGSLDEAERQALGLRIRLRLTEGPSWPSCPGSICITQRWIATWRSRR